MRALKKKTRSTAPSQIRMISRRPSSRARRCPSQAPSWKGVPRTPTPKQEAYRDSGLVAGPFSRAPRRWQVLQPSGQSPCETGLYVVRSRRTVNSASNRMASGANPERPIRCPPAHRRTAHSMRLSGTNAAISLMSLRISASPNDSNPCASTTNAPGPPITLRS
jgi:hypothetical protein